MEPPEGQLHCDNIGSPVQKFSVHESHCILFTYDYKKIYTALHIHTNILILTAPLVIESLLVGLNVPGAVPCAVGMATEGMVCEGILGTVNGLDTWVGTTGEKEELKVSGFEIGESGAGCEKADGMGMGDRLGSGDGMGMET
jgi:hypothetical protein